jgi:hypothetical protein
VADPFIEHIKEQIAQNRSMLEPLEKGQLRIGEARAGQPWADQTQARIDWLKSTIATLQSIVDRDNAHRT